MTYEQTTSLIDTMNDLELYSKLHNKEMNNDKIDWDSVGRYRDHIDLARRTIFNMVNDNV